MSVPSAAFRAGDVYIDYPYENMMFRFDSKTGKVFRKLHGTLSETEIPHTSSLFNEARIAGDLTTEEHYRQAGEKQVGKDVVKRFVPVPE